MILAINFCTLGHSEQHKIKFFVLLHSLVDQEIHQNQLVIISMYMQIRQALCFVYTQLNHHEHITTNQTTNLSGSNVHDMLPTEVLHPNSTPFVNMSVAEFGIRLGVTYSDDIQVANKVIIPFVSSIVIYHHVHPVYPIIELQL